MPISYILYILYRLGGEGMARAQVKKVDWKRTAIIIVAVYVVCHFIYGCFSIVDLKQQEKEIANQIETAYEEREQLQENIAYMGSEDAIEKTARERLGLVKEGEYLIQRADQK